MVPEKIFEDGFESGDLSKWSQSVIDRGNLSVSASAALVGSFGKQAVIDDNKAIYVTDESPAAEKRYRARFYFDPNSIAMASGNAHNLFIGYMGTGTSVFSIEIRYTSSIGYQMRAGILNDGGAWNYTGWFTISDQPHYIEIDWQASSTAGANNGSLSFWIDGVQKIGLSALDNDTRLVDRVRLGAVTGLDTGTRGTYYFDAYRSMRASYIGAEGVLP